MGLQSVKIAGWDSARPTYGAVQTNFIVDVAAGPSDVFFIQGSATKNIAVHYLEISGTATAQAIVNVAVNLRNGGTQTAGAGLTPAPFSPGYATATAVVNNYTTSPASVGTLVGGLAGGKLLYTPTSTTTLITPLVFNFSSPGSFTPVILAGTAQILALTFGALGPAGNTTAVRVVWSEY